MVGFLSVDGMEACMPSTRRAFLGAAATAPVWSLPVGNSAPERQWTYRNRGVVYPPLAGDGVLVTTVSASAFEGSRPRYVGLDERTGGTRWERVGQFDWQYDAPVDERFVARDGDTVEAVETATGRTAWAKSLGGDRVQGVLRGVDPGPAGRMAYATAETGVVAFDVETGERRWTRDGTEAVFHDATAETALVREGGDVLAVDAHTGRTLWGRALYSGPSQVHGGQVVVRRSSDLHALDVESGDLVWTYDPDDANLFVAGGNDQYVFVREESISYTEDEADEFVVALDDTGEVAWRYGLDDAGDVTLTEDALVVLGGFDSVERPQRSFTVIDLDDGGVRWRDEVEYAFGLLTASGGVLYVPTTDALVARSVHDGRVRWRYETRGDAVYGVARDGRVYVGERRDGTTGGTDDGQRAADTFALHAVDPPSGPLVAIETLAHRHDRLLAVLGALGVLGAAGAGVGKWLRRHRVAGHVETIEQRSAWTTARVENGRVRTEYRPTEPATDAFRDACEQWVEESGTDGVLALHEWGAEEGPWVETAPYADTLADGVPRERGLRAVSRVADTVARLDAPHGALRPTSVVLPAKGERTDDSGNGTADGSALVRDVGFGGVLRAGWPDGVDAYSPPEGAAATDAADVYGLGALAHVVLAGRPPESDGAVFDDPDFEASVPDDLRDVVETALASDPGERFDAPERFAEYFSWAAFAQARNW